MSEQMTLDDYDPRTHARSSDPSTSKAGARSVKLRAGTQKHRLLKAYTMATHGLTDQDAAYMADLLSVGYWKRCSDLRNDGLIEPMRHADGSLVTRPSRDGEAVMVCCITDLGMATLTATKEPHASPADSHIHVGPVSADCPACNDHTCSGDGFDGSCKRCCIDRHPVSNKHIHVWTWSSIVPGSVERCRECGATR